MIKKLAGTVLGAALAATALTAPAAAAPAAGGGSGAITGDPRVLNFAYKTEFRGDGISCDSVPLQGGGDAPVQMLVTSDSSKRTAEVVYLQSYYANRPFVWATGRIMVLEATHTYEGISGTASRPGPPAALRSTCSYSGTNGYGTAEVVHLQPVRPPSERAIAEYCATVNPYYPPSVCPGMTPLPR